MENVPPSSAWGYCNKTLSVQMQGEGFQPLTLVTLPTQIKIGNL